MTIVLNAALVYCALLLVFRVAGRRTFLQLTNFDLVLLLIISEATQSALVGRDTSLVGALLAVLTLIMLDIGLSLCKRRFPRVEKWIDGVPLMLIRRGKLLEERISRARLDADDILRAARESHGIATLEQIEYAILEPNGEISIIPLRDDAKA
jgi:uncharacterized membrane protein YcaP (DUF421 family)